MERIIAGPYITRKHCALRIILITVALALSGCVDDKKTDPPPVESFDLGVSVTGSGSVTSNPAGIDCGSDCVETLTAESSITLSATPGSGAMFTGWGGDCSGNAPSCTLTMSASRAVTASFSTNPPPPAAQYTLSVSVTGTGSVSSNPAGISCGTDCSENYTDGTSVTLTATAGTGFQFSSWGGACSGTGSCVVAMSQARSVTATFSANPPPAAQYTLSVSVTGTGSVSSNPAGISCGTDCSENYADGTSVTLTATAGAGFQFSSWGGACSGTGSCVVAMSQARSVTATFSANPPPAAQYTLSVSVTGTGSVSSTPSGISCGADCTESYSDGTSVTLTAAAGSGFQFSSWGGACSGSGACVVAMSAARSVTARFVDIAPPTITLTAPAAGNVSGPVMITAAAADNVGVAGVQFRLDSINLGGEDTSAPYSMSWNTTTLTPGTTYTLSAVARDAAGGMTTSQSVIVTVQTPPAGLVFFDNFEYVVNRNDLNAATTFRLQGGWTGAKTRRAIDPDVPGDTGESGANGWLYTTTSIPGYSGAFPGGAPNGRVLALEARPETSLNLVYQTDFYLEYGDGENPAYANTIPGDVWFQFWIYINNDNASGQTSFVDTRNKFIYPCNGSYPCQTGKWLIGLTTNSYVPSWVDLGSPSSSGGFLMNAANTFAGISEVTNSNSAEYDNRYKLGHTDTSGRVTTNRWTLVKIHVDTSTSSGKYETWMRPLGGAWTKVASWIDGVTPGFTWTISDAHIGGHRTFRMPTTMGRASGAGYPSWYYMDDFAMARSEAALPQYSDLPAN